MGHITSENFKKLQKRLDKSIQGAPESETLYKILETLFTEKEAKLVSVLPMNLFKAKKAAKLWDKTEEESLNILNELADKGILFDITENDQRHFVLAPTMPGFFEFSTMRTDGRFNRKLLSELFHQYMNVEDGFTNQVFALDPSIARTFIQEVSLDDEAKSVILDYEKASKVIENASAIAVGTCYCRHKMEHMGKACNQPQDVCFSFNNPAKSLAKHGIAKEISKEEALEILNKCVDSGLVQIGDNIQDKVGWICNCCSCCCEGILAYKKLGYGMKIRNNHYPNLEKETCTNCSICSLKCPVDAIEMVEAENNKKYPKINLNRCFGCGVCNRFCPSKSLKLKRKNKTTFVPKDTFERFVITAINQGKLQNFIFNNYKLWSYDLLRKLLGIILNLKPAKRALASRQLQSRFLNTFTKSKKYSHPELKK